MIDGRHPMRELTEALVRESFAANPALARWDGEHSYDGVMIDSGPAAVRRRVASLHGWRDRLSTLPPDGRDAEERADLGTAIRIVADELFHLEVLRDPQTDPQWALWRGADVSPYVSRDYAPAAQRAESLARHLEQLPDWLEAAAAPLEPELAAGPRSIAIESARGFAAYYRDEARRELGEIGDATLVARLGAAIEPAARACDAYAARLEAMRVCDDAALGAETFCAMLAAQEGVDETADALRARADDELDRLTARAAEVSTELHAASVAEAFSSMEALHPTAETLLDTAQGMLDRLRDFWLATGVVSVPTDVRCTVRPTPGYMGWATAAYENPGPLDPPGLPHFYYVTTVRPDWTAQQAEEWLQHLNLPVLENISVHECYPGHFAHAVAGLRQPSLVRRAYWFGGFGEGWAHYTELLAIEHGLAEGRPLHELAMLQDALLRACRFRATVGMHCEGMTLDEATRLFQERAHVPRLPAEREALRGTHDPMYLVYTYGKLEIIKWREQLAAQPGFDLRGFHDRMISSGFPPLAVVRDYILNAVG